jgi:hypothetical protein
MRVRLAAVGALDLSTGAAQRALLAVERASEAHGRRYFRSRTRRCLRPGRLYRPLRLGEQRGLRLATFPEATVGEALAASRRALAVDERALAAGPGDPVSPRPASEGEILKLDHRARITATRAGGRNVVVKEVVKSGLGRRLADLFRGSPARRAWRGGHGLRIRGIRAATPLAFVETRRAGIPVASTVILEDLRPARPASQFDPEAMGPESVLDEGCRLALLLHHRKVVHGDLQALHIYLERHGEGLRSALIDLEGVRFPQRLSDRQRIQALAELNASLADEWIPPADRCRAFERYARALPFRMGSRRALERVVKLSLERRHAWKGLGCAAAQSRVNPDGV